MNLPDRGQQWFHWTILLTVLTVAIAVMCGCFALTFDRPDDARPLNASLVLCENVHDIGETSIREERQISFPIRNLGARRLVLNELDLECGCGDRVQRTILIAPGETVEVIVLLDTRFDMGRVENAASFTTNDPAHPRFDLKVRAFVATNVPMPADPDGSKRVSVLIRQ